MNIKSKTLSKNKMICIWLIILLPVAIPSYAQLKNPVLNAEEKLSITEVTIADSALRASIISYIDSLPNIDPGFKQYGYLSLRIKNREKKKQCYNLNRSYYYQYPDQEINLPLFYSFVNNRLVLIYTNLNRIANYKVKRKSIKKLAKLVNSTLPKIEYIYIEDEVTHEKKKLIPGGNIVLEQGGIDICI